MRHLRNTHAILKNWVVDRKGCGRHVSKETLESAEMSSLIVERPTGLQILWVITFRRQSEAGKTKLTKTDLHEKTCK